jgi:hypothetical protein
VQLIIPVRLFDLIMIGCILNWLGWRLGDARAALVGSISSMLSKSGELLEGVEDICDPWSPRPLGSNLAIVTGFL